MKTLLNFFLVGFVFSTLLFTSNACKNRGYKSINTKELAVSSNCVNSTITQVRIDDDYTYHKLFDSSACTASLPAVDFSNHTVVGIWIDLPGNICNAECSAKLLVNDKDKTYRFIVKCIEDASCGGLAVLQNDRIFCSLAPKLNPNYQIVYKIEHKGKTLFN